MQFADVACALKTQTAIKSVALHFLGRMQPNFFTSRTEFLLSAVWPHLPVFYRCIPTRTNGSRLFWDRQNSPDVFFAKGHFFCNVAIKKFSDQSQGSFRCRTLPTVRLIRFAFRHSSNKDTLFTPFRNKGASSTLKIEDTNFLTSLSEFSYYSIMIASGNQYNFTQNILFHLR